MSAAAGLPPASGGPGAAGSSGESGGAAGQAVRAPAELELMPPGSGLARVLDKLPAERLANGDVVSVMVAAYRQATHYRALFLKLVHEVALCVPGPDSQVCRGSAAHIDEFTEDEIAAALAWSRTRARNTLGLAIEMTERLPAVGAAMLAGQIDEPRAKAFCDWTTDLSEEHTAAVVAHVLPRAGDMTVGQICEAIQRTAIALDPTWAQRRYEESVRRRKVVLSQGPAGTATLAGHELPADRAAAAHIHIIRLAKRCKRAGDRRPIDLIRADVYLGMMDGTFQQMTDEQIVAHVLAHPIAGDPTTADEDSADGSDEPKGPDGPDGPEQPEGPGGPKAPDDPDGPHCPTSPDEPEAPDEPEVPDEPDGSEGAPPGSRGDAPSGAGGGRGSSGGTPDGRREPGEGGPASGTATRPPSPVWSPAELRVRLGTLLGMNNHPGELPGYGYIPAITARSLIAQMLRGQWRYVVCAPTGIPVATGLLRARPANRGATGRRDARGGVVELQLTTDELDTLAAMVDIGGSPADWAGVLTEIVNVAGAGTVRSSGESTSPDRRFADLQLRRWVQVRDRSCLFPQCRAPSTQTDQDHRIDYATGGATSEENLDSLCRHHHRLKHEGGWRLNRSGALTWAWTSRLGRSYRAMPPPVMPPLPQPGSFA